MPQSVHCAYCGEELDAGMLLDYEYQSLNFTDDEQQIELIRNDSRFYGEPLPTCKKCTKSLSMNDIDRREDEEFGQIQLRIYKMPFLMIAVCLLIYILLSFVFQ